MAAAELDVTVIVVAYRSAATIEDCIASLSAGSTRPDGGRVALQVVLVDNRSPDDSDSRAASVWPEIEIIHLSENLGFAAGVNAGLALARAPHVLLLNPDASVCPGGLAQLLDFARTNPRHGLYGGHVLRPDGSADPRSCFGLPTMWSILCYGLGLTTLFPGSRWFDRESLGWWPRDDVREVGVLSGCFLLARRSLLIELGGLDEAYFMYSEDVDLSVRARASGAAPVFVPFGAVVHLGGGSSTSVDKAILVLRGKATFVERNWSVPRTRVARYLLQAGVFLRAMLVPVARGRGQEWRQVWRRRGEWRRG